jgi:hypothetical protein
MAPEPRFIPLTVRRLKPGEYDAWRDAWYVPEDPAALWVEAEAKAYILRNIEDPDEVIAFGFIDGERDELTRLHDDPVLAGKLRKRAEAMREHVEEVLLDGTYEVVEVVTREQALRERSGD